MKIAFLLPAIMQFLLLQNIALSNLYCIPVTHVLIELLLGCILGAARGGC